MLIFVSRFIDSFLLPGEREGGAVRRCGSAALLRVCHYPNAALRLKTINRLKSETGTNLHVCVVGLIEATITSGTIIVASPSVVIIVLRT